MGFLILPMLNIRSHTPVFGAFLGARSLRAVANEQQFCRLLRTNRCKHINHIFNALDRSKIRNVRDDRLSIWGYRSTELFVGISFKMGRADKVMNHFNFPINPEQFQRVAFEAVRYSRHRIGFVDGVGNDRFECGVFPEQGDVRSMQRRDNGHVDAFFGEDVTRGNRGTRVGNGVVHMEKVEVMGFGHFDHLRGQDQFIRLVIEKRIVADTYLVVVEVFFQTPHTSGSAVRNEMELVPLVREGLTQFSGDHTGPPERGVLQAMRRFIIQFALETGWNPVRYTLGVALWFERPNQ